MMSRYMLLYLFSVFLAALSQLLLKISADKHYKSRLKEYFNFYVITAYMLFFLTTILTILSLRGISVKRAPVIESMGYLYVMFLGRIVLKERITIKKLIGNVLILIGIFIFNFP